MDELVKRINPHFAYEWHEIEDDIMRVYVRSRRKDAQCPYCGSMSKQVHSVYPRKFRDLPIQGMKVEVVIRNRKFYCQNAECGHKTFAESYECLPRMARRSQQLTQAIVHTATNTSSITASKMLGEGTADVGKSTICRLLKKERTDREENR